MSKNERKRAGRKGKEKGEFSHDLGLIDAFAIGLGTMMGAGIFVLSAEAASRAGPGSVFTYVIASLIVLPVAMTLSELATAIPEEGGSYTLVSRSLGPLASAIVGPANWIGLIFAIGFYLIGFARYFSSIWEIPHWIIVIILGGFITFLNYRGAKLSGRFEVFVVAVLLLILVGFSVTGVFNIQADLHEPFLPEGWTVVLGTIGLIIVSFTGFEKISSISEELNDPKHILPRAVIGSVLIAMIVYAGVLFVLTGVLPYQGLAEIETPLVQAAEQFLGSIGGVVMLFGGLLATVSASNAAIMSSSRINYAMARDRLIPAWFDEIHPRFSTPHRAVIITGILAIGLALTGQVETLAEVSSALFMVSYALLVLSLFVMRKISPEWYQPSFKVPLFPWIPLVGGVASLGVIMTKDRFSQIAGFVIIIASLIFYFLWSKKHVQIHGEAEKLFNRDTEKKGQSNK